MLSADFTHVEGRNDFRALEINPLINGVRRLAPALQAAFGDPDLIGPLQIQGRSTGTATTSWRSSSSGA